MVGVLLVGSVWFFFFSDEKGISDNSSTFFSGLLVGFFFLINSQWYSKRNHQASTWRHIALLGTLGTSA